MEERRIAKTSTTSLSASKTAVEETSADWSTVPTTIITTGKTAEF